MSGVRHSFRKTVAVPYVDKGSVSVGKQVTAITRSVVPKGASEPTTYVEMKEVDIEDFAKGLGLPKSEDYQLRDMIKAGQIPEEVPVRGMLDSNDPLDSSNNGFVDAAISKMVDSAPSEPQKPASELVSTPEPTTTPSE